MILQALQKENTLRLYFDKKKRREQIFEKTAKKEFLETFW